MENSYKNLIHQSRLDETRRVRVAYLCKFLQRVGPMTRLMMLLKLQKIAKYEKIDKTPVNQASASDDRTCSGKHW
jgi:hypothetical protein